MTLMDRFCGGDAAGSKLLLLCIIYVARDICLSIEEDEKHETLRREVVSLTDKRDVVFFFKYISFCHYASKQFD
jgi:hypothetical protein